MLPTNADAIVQAIFDSNYGTSSNATAQVGKLNPEQADRFIDYIFDQTILTKVCRVFRMNAPERRVPKIGIGSKPLKPAVRGTDPGVTILADPTEVTLNTNEMIAEAFILDDELEDNVEGQDWRDHFMQILGRQIGNQLEYAYLMAYSTAGSPTAVDILQLMNGWWYNCTQNGGHVQDATTYLDPSNNNTAVRTITTSKFGRVIKNIPIKYRTQAYDLRFLISPNTYQDFTQLVGNRATPFGDVAYQSAGYDKANLPQNFQSILGWGGVPMYSVPLLPENLFVQASSPVNTTLNGAVVAGATTAVLANSTGIAVGAAVKIDTGAKAETVIVTANNTGTNTITFTVPANSFQTSSGNSSGLLYGHSSGVAAVSGTADGSFILATHFQNLIVGIQRDIRVEFWRDIRARGWYVVVTLRADCTVENPDAMSIMTNTAIAA